MSFEFIFGIGIGLIIGMNLMFLFEERIVRKEINKARKTLYSSNKEKKEQK